MIYDENTPDAELQRVFGASREYVAKREAMFARLEPIERAPYRKGDINKLEPLRDATEAAEAALASLPDDASERERNDAGLLAEECRAMWEIYFDKWSDYNYEQRIERIENKKVA